MATYNELVYFDEPIKGDRLLITSRLISYCGKIIDTPAVERLTRIARTVSVNAVPTGANFQLIVASASAEITFDCARFGGAMWLGQGQFHRAGSELFEAAGKRLISEAIENLRAGATLVWHHKPASFEKDSTVRLFHAGISIKQTGVIFNKNLSISWPQLAATKDYRIQWQKSLPESRNKAEGNHSNVVYERQHDVPRGRKILGR
jgi:hypothetical protein